MPFKLDLPFWEARGWKVKIFDKEGPEEPHVNVTRERHTQKDLVEAQPQKRNVSRCDTGPEACAHRAR